MSHRDNLPDNVTDKMIDDHFGSNPCPECEGDGEIMKWEDESVGWFPVECPDCEGTGVATPNTP